MQATGQNWRCACLLNWQATQQLALDLNRACKAQRAGLLENKESLSCWTSGITLKADPSLSSFRPGQLVKLAVRIRWMAASPAIQLVQEHCR